MPLIDQIERDKINLYDSGVKFKFHDDQSLIVISSSEKSTVLDCRTTTERDEWLGALASAQERVGVDRESSGLVLSEEDSDDSSESTTHSLEPNAGARHSVDDDGDGYNDVLLALQDVRDSMIQCNLSMGAASEDLVMVPDASVSDQRGHAMDMSDDQLRATSLQSVCDFIEGVDHGGRVILLHAGVLASAGIGMEDVLRALGERQRENPRLSTHSTPSVSQRKQHAGKFVRDMLFHPIYSKRPEVNREAVQEVIDRFFPHCRLRRFSDDVEHIQEHKQPVAPCPSPPPKTTDSPTRNAAPVQAVNSPSNLPPADVGSPLTTGSSWLIRRKKMRHHSFPNLLSLAGLAKPSGLVGSSTNAASTSSSAPQAKSARPREPTPCVSPTHDSVVSILPTCAIPSHEDSDRIELTPSETPPLEPLRSLLWKFSCVELAEQLTLFHHRHLTGICLWDFPRNPRDAARELTEHFNRLVAFFVWSVLGEDTPKDRAEVIEEVISIAHAASEPPLLNFHLVMICVGCLGDMPLMRSRLPTTWKKVRAKYKALLAELRKLCDHSGGFDKLKRRQSEETSKPALSPTSSASVSSSSSFVPFIGVVGVALERLRTSSYFTVTKVLDLEKLERQYLALRVLETAIMRPPPSCRPRESSASSIDNVDRTASSGAISRDATIGIQRIVQTMDMAFATPRLHNLRSQQILASECSPLASSSSGSRTASAFFMSPSRTSWNSQSAASAAASSASASPSVARSSPSSSSLSTGDDFNSTFLSFRLTCDLLTTIPDASERVNVALEALLADERQPAARFVRRFWLEVRHNMAMRSAAMALQGLRDCVATLLRDVLTFKAAELMQLSGLDESSAELWRMVYAKLVRLVTQPVFGWVVPRVKLAMASEDAKARLAVEKYRQHQRRKEQTVAMSLGSPSSPMDLLEQLVQVTRRSPATITPVEVGNEDVAAADVAALLEALALFDGSFLRAHAASAAFLLKQLLDPLYLARQDAASLDALDRTVSRLLAESARGRDEGL